MADISGTVPSWVVPPTWQQGQELDLEKSRTAAAIASDNQRRQIEAAREMRLQREAQRTAQKDFERELGMKNAADELEQWKQANPDASETDIAKVRWQTLAKHPEIFTTPESFTHFEDRTFEHARQQAKDILTEQHNAYMRDKADNVEELRALGLLKQIEADRLTKEFRSKMLQRGYAPSQHGKDLSTIKDAEEALKNAIATGDEDVIAEAQADLDRANRVIDPHGQPAQFKTDHKTGLTVMTWGNRIIVVPQDPVKKAQMKAVGTRLTDLNRDLATTTSEKEKTKIRTAIDQANAELESIGGVEQAKPAAPLPSALPKITSQAEYDKLPSGKKTRFIGPDGQEYFKP